MNKKTLIIVSSRRENSGARKLREAAEKYGLNAEIAVINENDVVGLVNTADYVLFRVTPTTYQYYETILPELRSDHAQRLANFLTGFDKSVTYDILQKNDIATPASYDLIKGEAVRSFPAVIKVRHGNQGNGVALLTNQAEFDAFIAAYDEDSYLMQEFIEQAAGHDKRLLIAGGALMGAMERHSVNDDFRANLHLGGRAEAYTPTAEEIDLAMRSAEAFGLDLVGVDIIDSANGPQVLEVNPSPGLAIGEILGIDIAMKIVEELYHD